MERQFSSISGEDSDSAWEKFEPTLYPPRQSQVWTRKQGNLLYRPGGFQHRAGVASKAPQGNQGTVMDFWSYFRRRIGDVKHVIDTRQTEH